MSVPQPWLKPAVWVGGLVPLAALALGAVRHTLGADAIALSLNRLGLTTLVFLVAALACTPVRMALGWTWPLRIRRMLGLFAMFYAALHFLTYIVLDQFFDWAIIFADLTQRKFILVGFLGLVLMVPLAVTSTNASVRRLGFPRWKRLHRLAYVVTALGALHFFLRVKRDHTEPLVYGFVVVVLLAVRFLPPAKKKARTRLVL